VLGGGVILPRHVQERHRSGVTDRFRFVVFVHFAGSAFFANPRDFPWERSQPVSARRTRRVAHSSDEFRLDGHMDFKFLLAVLAGLVDDNLAHRDHDASDVWDTISL
jgi:hypothetical protein